MILTKLVGRQTASLLKPPFLPYWVGQSISAFGDQITVVVLPIIVLALGGGAADLAKLASWSSGVQVLLLLAGGVLVDRIPTRKLMLLTDGLRAILLGVVAWQFSKGGASITMLIVLSACLGACASVFNPASASILPQLVDDKDLLPANALRNLTDQLSATLGPAIGGLLVAVSGAGLALGIDALTFACGFMGLLLMRPKTSPPREAGEAPIWHDLKAGFAVVFSSTWLWVTVSIASFINIFGAGLYVVIIPLFASESLGNISTLGWLYSAQAIGAIFMSALLGRIGEIRNRGIVCYTSLAIYGLSVVLFSMVYTLLSAITLMFVAGACLTVFGVVWEATLQERVPNEMLGRVSSITLLGGISLMPMGFVLVGQMIKFTGLTTGILICGLLITVLSLGGLSLRSIRAMK